jgi:hypothetical protein
MNRTTILTGKANISLFVMMLLVIGSLVVAPVTSAYANEKQEATQLVEKSRLTLNSFTGDLYRN